MSNENINEESNVTEKNIPVFIETDGHTVQVGWASEVNENGGRVIEKFSAFKKVVLVNPIFGDGEGEIQAPIENHVDPEEDGLTQTDRNETQTADGQLYAGVKQSEPGIKSLLEDHGVKVDQVTIEGNEQSEEDEEAQTRREARKNTQPVDGGTDASLNAAPVSADADGDTAVGQPLPAANKGDKPNPFTRTN